MRNRTIDQFRGLIMIIMAIDHVSYFILRVHFHEGYDYFTSADTALPFLTRFITHLCAPGFFFAMGYGAYFKYNKEGSKGKLVIRGLFLIFLQITLIDWIWDIGILYFGVISALGGVMILLQLSMPLLKKYGHFIAFIAIFITQYLISYSPLVDDENILRIFVSPGMYKGVYILYVILPWYGLAALGVFIASHTYNNYRLYGAVALTLFCLLRLFDAFGNTHHPSGGWIEFINVTKYPPSIVFLLLTMGINFLLMALLKENTLSITNPLTTFGQAPLLFYILHLGLYRLMAAHFSIQDYGQLYLIWLFSLPLLYLPCKYLSKRRFKIYLESWRKRLH